MSVAYEIWLDKNGDGFICFDAQPGDPLNLFPGGVNLATLNTETDGAATVALKNGETAYGTRYFECAFTGAGFEQVFIGYDGTTADQIAVTPGATYSAAGWVRSLADATGLDLSFRILTPALTLIAGIQTTPDAAWSRYEVTFTVPAGVDDVVFALSTDDMMTVQATGFMLVEGATLPTGYNSGDPRDLDDRITADVLDMRWEIGLREVYDSVSMPTRGEITLLNTTQAYSPEISTVTLAPGTMVRVRVVDDTQTHLLFTGWIDHVAPQAGDLGGRVATLHLHGPEDQLREVQVLTELRINVRAKGVIEAVLFNTAFDRFTRQLDEGVSLFAYAGDTWSDGIRASTAIRQIVEAERGRFFTDRAGHLVFYDRDHDYGASVASFEDAFEDVTYTYGEGLVNQVRVTVRPRQVGTPGSTLWELNTAQFIPAGQFRTITARLRDANGNSIGGTTFQSPLAYTDYTANTAADGSGTDVTADIFVRIAIGGFHGSAVTLDVLSFSGSDAYLQPGTRLRGTPLLQNDPILIEQTDWASVQAYGLHLLEFNLPYFVTVEEANTLAATELARRKTPFGAIKTLTLSRRAGYESALSLTLFDRISVSESHTAHQGEYLIIGEAHTIDLAGNRHEVTWLLEPIFL